MVVSLRKIFITLSLSLFLFVNLSFAAQVEKERKVFYPTNSKYASWVFLGMVENEVGEIYNYFFQIKRNNFEFSAKVALFNFQTKSIVLQENSSATIKDPGDFHWIVGRSFLKYNKITNSWVFGLKEHSKKGGFNFKVSMLNKPEDSPVTRYFKNGVSFVVAQAGQLNGHISVDSDIKDQFVTARNTWFRQIWLKKDPENRQSLNSLLCRFNDGKSLYSIRVLDKATIQDSIAGLFAEDGSPIIISQFINIEKNRDSSWRINIPTPRESLLLSDVYRESNLAAGFIANDNRYGFCMLSNDDIGLKSEVANNKKVDSNNELKKDAAS